MELIADILLMSGAIGAGFYCFVLGRRLKKFNSLENGVGGAVAVLSSQVEDLQKTLASAQQTAAVSAETLNDLTIRAEEMAKRLELQMASMHDIPELPEKQTKTPSASKPQTTAEPMFTRHAGGKLG